MHIQSVIRAEMLVKGFFEYEHSSASFYEIQLVKYYGPMHYLDL